VQEYVHVKVVCESMLQTDMHIELKTVWCSALSLISII